MPPSQADPNDFTNRYNTKLSPGEEIAFQSWVSNQSAARGRDMSKDLYDYDLRGFWKNGTGFADNGHGSDAYKKPNHPTFSDQSQYHGVDGYTGGSWSKGAEGNWTFEASNTNTQFHPPERLVNYVRRAEPKNKLVLPASSTNDVFGNMVGP